MKRSFFVFALSLMTLSNTVFAQNNVSRLQKPSQESPLKGAYIGLDYMNLSDLKVSSELKTSNGSSSYDSTGSTHLGLLGIRLGYGQTPESGLGYEGGVRFLESFNQSEYEDTKIYMIIPEANLKIALNKLLVAFAGVNFSMITGSSLYNDYKGQLGAQAGFGFRLPYQVAINLGYTMMNQKFESRGSNASLSGDVRLSGFNSNVVYLF